MTDAVLALLAESVHSIEILEELSLRAQKVLRDAGHIGIKLDLGREYLDTGRCRAFAVSDHQIAHVYVRDAGAIDDVRRLFEATPGVDAVLDAEGKVEAEYTAPPTFGAGL